MSYLPDADINTLANQTLVMLLAGGQGSRLHELTQDRAKPSLEFGGAYKLIDFPLSNCVNSGFKKIGVVTQYKAHTLLRHLVGEWSNFNRYFGEFLELMPASQQRSNQWYQGTADSLFQNIDFIKSVMPKYVLVLSGDHIYTMDYREMLKTHVNTGAQMTVSCIRVPASDAAGQFGVMNVDQNDRIISFEEKPLRPRGLTDSPNHVLASMGNYIFNTDCLIELLQRDAQDSDSEHDFGKNIIPLLIKDEKVQAFRFLSTTSKSAPYWKDVGTLDAYWKANMAMLGEHPAINLSDSKWPIIGASTCPPPTKFIRDLSGSTADVINTLISGGCNISNCKIAESLLFDRVEIMSNAQVFSSILLPNVKIGKHAVIKRAIIDRDCIVPDNMKIGINIKDDIARGFRISKNDVVLVTKKMLEGLSKVNLLKPQILNIDCVNNPCTRPSFHARLSKFSMKRSTLDLKENANGK
jgi:glucose-1-phosphate adenylyltransferase